MPSLQAAASVGQSALATAYAEVFAAHGIVTSTVLLTRRDTADRHAYLHARNTLLRLLELGVVPIINENDTIAVEQIKFGDNDTLAALAACLIDADLMVILSDIDGLYDGNPNTNPDAKLIPHVESIGPEILAVAGGAGSTVGSGGMITKIKAARVLMVAGIPMIICYGRQPHVVEDAAAGKAVGTRFSALEKPHEITPRKLWIALGDSARGAVVVDEGAKSALIGHGKSLLCVGVASVEGRFEAGRHRRHQRPCGPSVRPRLRGVLRRRGGALPRPKLREVLERNPACWPLRPSVRWCTATSWWSSNRGVLPMLWIYDRM